MLKQNMITKEFREKISNDWINSWNAYEIDSVLLHYAEDVTIETPRALEIIPANQGFIEGKEALRKYWYTSMEKSRFALQLLEFAYWCEYAYDCLPFIGGIFKSQKI